MPDELNNWKSLLAVIDDYSSSSFQFCSKQLYPLFDLSWLELSDIDKKALKDNISIYIKQLYPITQTLTKIANDYLSYGLSYLKALPIKKESRAMKYFDTAKSIKDTFEKGKINSIDGALLAIEDFVLYYLAIASQNFPIRDRKDPICDIDLNVATFNLNSIINSQYRVNLLGNLKMNTNEGVKVLRQLDPKRSISEVTEKIQDISPDILINSLKAAGDKAKNMSIRDAKIKLVSLLPVKQTDSLSSMDICDCIRHYKECKGNIKEKKDLYTIITILFYCRFMDLSASWEDPAVENER